MRMCSTLSRSIETDHKRYENPGHWAFCLGCWRRGGDGGLAFVSGGVGGVSLYNDVVGGFGGGGGAYGYGGGSGGGGGYSGGAAGDNCSNSYAGGGGSYNSGLNQVNESGVNDGHGSVTIFLISFQ